MARILLVPLTDATAWDDASQPSTDLVRVLEDVERALAISSEPPARLMFVARPTPRLFTYAGSSVALALAHLGVHHLTLIDPDHLELHDVGEMASVTTAALGCSKVQAVAAEISALGPPSPDVVPVPTSITRWPALHAV